MEGRMDLPDVPAMLEFDLLTRALLIAAVAHNKQLDKAIPPQPYILHPLRVMLEVREFGETAMAIAVLHDTVEDTPVSLQDIELLFGKEIAIGVDAVSRRKEETYREYIYRVAEHPLGWHIKMADINDNMSPERQTPELAGLEKRYRLAIGILQEVKEKREKGIENANSLG